MTSLAMQNDPTGPTGDDAAALESGLVRRVELPEQQRRIVTLIARGYSTDQIAERLRLSRNTVQAHRRAALLKLGLHSGIGLTHYAIVSGLVEPGDVPGDMDPE